MHASEAVTDAWVKVQVDVGADGVPTNVRVLTSSDPAFEASAIGCAMSKRFHPALDAGGKPVAASLAMKVRFVR